MKKVFLFAVVFVLVMVILVSCRETITDENGVEHEYLHNHWVVIEDLDYSQYIVYDPTTKIIYFLCDGDYGSGITPYQTRNEDGFICGAIYENSQITPVPYFPID